MNKIIWMSVLGISLLTGCASQQVSDPPNILLIISDDQAWSDYSFMGHDVIQTPHLDRLAAQSLTFTRGYVPTSVCRPSLATIITGLYAHQHGIVGNDPTARPGKQGGQLRRNGDPQFMAKLENMIQHIEQSPTLPRLLKKKGYVSFQTGKWWEGHHSRGGFDEGMTHGDPSRSGRHGDEGLRISRESNQPIYDFIDSARAKDKPFFIWHAPFLPHQPHNPPQRLLDKYKKLAPGIHEDLAKYYAMCDWFDETCGELVNYIDNEGLGRDTLIVYVTDNGWIQTTPDTAPENWRIPFMPRSKLSPYEGGTRTPIMLRWTGTIEPHRDEKTLVSSIDLVPTILNIVGLKPTTDMHGLNLQDRKALAKRKAVFGESFEHNVVDLDNDIASLNSRWIVQGDWKLILPQPGNRLPEKPELYNLADDPHEMNDLSAKYPEMIAALSKRINNWWNVD